MILPCLTCLSGHVHPCHVELSQSTPCHHPYSRTASIPHASTVATIAARYPPYHDWIYSIPVPASSIAHRRTTTVKIKIIRPAVSSIQHPSTAFPHTPSLDGHADLTKVLSVPIPPHSIPSPTTTPPLPHHPRLPHAKLVQLRLPLCSSIPKTSIQRFLFNDPDLSSRNDVLSWLLCIRIWFRLSCGRTIRD